MDNIKGSTNSSHHVAVEITLENHRQIVVTQGHSLGFVNSMKLPYYSTRPMSSIILKLMEGYRGYYS